MQATNRSGRAAGLAAALTLGLAVATGHGVAVADTGAGNEKPDSVHDRGADGSKADTGPRRTKNSRTPAETTASTGRDKQSGGPEARIHRRGDTGDSKRAKQEPPAITAHDDVPVMSTPLSRKTIDNVAHTMMSSAATFFGIDQASAIPTPGAPSMPLRTILELVFAARRPFTGLLFNNAPTVAVGEQTRLPTGNFTGAVKTKDIDGDTVTLSVSKAPAQGTVELFADGTYVYVANPGFTGTDTFTVIADDNHRALLANLFTATGRDSETITIDVQPATNAITYDFHVINLTQRPLLFRGLSKCKNDCVKPEDGTYLNPGETHTFTGTYYALSESYMQAEYGVGDHTYSPYMWISGANVVQSNCSASSDTCAITQPTTIYLLEKPGTVIDLPATQYTAALAAMLDGLCVTGSRASCSFSYKRTEKAFATNIPAGATVTNDVPQPIINRSITVTGTTTQATTFSASAAATLNIAKVVSTELSASYGRTLTVSKTFSQTVAIPSLPGYTRVSITSEQPVLRDYGDLTILVGNTTFIARDFHLDSPDPDGQSRYVVRSTALPHTSTPDESASTETDSAQAVASSVSSVRVLAPRTTPAATPMTVPDAPPSILSTLSALINQVRRSVVNTAPTATPVITTRANDDLTGIVGVDPDDPTATSVVTGSIRGADADGDRLTYSVSTAPVKGQVVLSGDGSFAYQPGAELAATGGTDVFEVAITDGHRALLVASGSGIRPSSYAADGSITVAITITVPAPAATLQPNTAGFDIVNNTSIPLVFRGYAYGGGNVDSGPARYSTLLPGEVHHIELKTLTFDTTSRFEKPVYGTATQDLYSGIIGSDTFGREVHCSTTSRGNCTTTDPSTVTFLDSAGTEVHLTAAEGGDFLNRVCNSGQASCKLTLYPPLEPEKVTGNPRPYGSAVVNLTDFAVTTSLTTTTTVTSTTSLSFSTKVSEKFLTFINTTYSASYKTDFTTSTQFTDSTGTITVPAGQTRSVIVTEPLLRSHGDFEVRMGQTKFFINGVNLDRGDPTGQADFRVTDQPLS
ncbi:hypothetical protein MycrhDRAFT_3585 [Mycolicibacterium rhodesiae JS60]|nr:hypothetical protein MycrhDRAFT_3585 [Mycolicibacterium rhodesiae JS60]